MAKTVRDFKNFVKTRTGKSGGDFGQSSDNHLAFWRKLNKIGARNLKIQQQDTEVPDIDATVILTNQEWVQLETELQQLMDQNAEIIN